MKLRTSQWTAEHPTHGTFFVTQLVDGGSYDCSRVFGEHPGLQSELFARGCESLYVAAEAITWRIHELDQDALVVEPPVTVVIPEAT